MEELNQEELEAGGMRRSVVYGHDGCILGENGLHKLKYEPSTTVHRDGIKTFARPYLPP